MLFPQENSTGLGQVRGEVRGVSILGGFQGLAGQSLSDVLKSWSYFKWEAGLGTPVVPSNQHLCYFSPSPIQSGH